VPSDVIEHMLANVRRNLVGQQHVARIRRARCFRVRCLDPVTEPPLDAHFAAVLAVVFRPILDSATGLWSPSPAKDGSAVVSAEQPGQWLDLVRAPEGPPVNLRSGVAPAGASDLYSHV
jgi:hypothetical protein